MKQKLHTALLMIWILAFPLSVAGQNTIKGKIIDSQKKEPLIGATIIIEESSEGTVTDAEGHFVLKTLMDTPVTLRFKCLGSVEQSRVISFQGKEPILETIELEPSSIGLDEIKVLASFVKSKGKTPVVYSTITPVELETKLSNKEFPEILKSTPSVYATRQGGGMGDARISLRGFDSNNIGVLINGIPVNGMENGSVYWSNWAALADVTQTIQVQRGIGMSKLGIPSVGGTINIVTNTIDTQQGGSVYYGLGNDGYQKMAVMLSSGLMKNGWAFTLSGSRTVGNGYVNGTNFEGWSYFLNLSKRINENNLLSFTAFGAPQWHNMRGNRHLIQDYENHKDGIRMNTSYGYLNGEVLATGGGYNEYHKPQLSVNHFWTINDKSTLSSSVYASLAKGGGRKVYGGFPQKMIFQYDAETGRPHKNTLLTPDGLIDYNAGMEQNRDSDHGSDAFFSMGTNAHDWYGMLTTYANKLSDVLNLTVGVDGRYYKGYHYEKIEDLLGGAYYKENIAANKLAYRDPASLLKVGDKVGYDNISYILWMGTFAQIELNKPRYNAFLSASISDHKYKRKDPGLYGEFGNKEKYPVSEMETDWINFKPVSIKAGFNYKLAEIHNVYINGGYVTKAPMFDGVFPAKDNNMLTDIRMEKVITGEIGYGINTRTLSVNLNAYYTRWNDRTVSRKVGNTFVAIPNVDALHKGIELEVTYRPLSVLSLGGALSVGDWKWANDADFVLYDEQMKPVGEYHAYMKDLHVGNSAQTSAALTASWEPFRNLIVGADWNYYGRNYADFDPRNRNNPDDRAEAWKLPDYSTVDLNLNYRFKIGNIKAIMYANINNLLNKEYIADAKDGKDHNRETALVWYGFGTTWTTGLRLSF